MSTYTDEQRTAFGLEMARLRRRAGLSQTALADRLTDYNQSVVSSWERAARRPPEPPVVAQLEAALDAEPGALAGTLGYRWLTSTERNCDITAAVLESALPGFMKRTLLQTYESLLEAAEQMKPPR